MTKPAENDTSVPEGLARCGARWALLIFGWANVVVGAIGIVVPGLPTTVFLLIALWAFSKSSDRFQAWLWEHPRLGPPIRAWHEHHVIPLRAKMLAAVMMSASFVYVTFFVAEDWVLPSIMAAMLIPSAAFVLSRASQAPETAEVPVQSDQ